MQQSIRFIVFSHLRWGFVFQRPQHILSRFAKKFPLVFVEEPVRSENDETTWEVLNPIPNVTVVRLHTPLASTGFSDDQLALIKANLNELDTLKSIQAEDHRDIAWMYSPLALPLLENLNPYLVVFDSMDALDHFANAPVLLKEREAALLDRFPIQWDSTTATAKANDMSVPTSLAASAAVAAVIEADVVIVGAGPTGLSATYHLQDRALLLEKNDRIGGWCRSRVEGGFTFDFAGHIMFSNDPYVHELYDILLGDNCHWQDREAWVYSHGVHTRYPFQGALHGLPPDVIRECLMGASEARFGSADSKKAETPPKKSLETLANNRSSLDSRTTAVVQMKPQTAGSTKITFQSESHFVAPRPAFSALASNHGVMLPSLSESIESYCSHWQSIAVMACV